MQTARKPVGVAGAAGLLGRAVVAELLAAGYAVKGADRVPPPAVPADQYEHVIVELTDYAAVLRWVEGCSSIVQLAALPTPTSAAPAEIWRINTTIIGNVLIAAKECGIARVVMASSQSALGLPYARSVASPLYLPVDEAHPRWPSDIYSASKAASEDLASALCRGGGINVCCLRYPVVWDPANRAEHVARRLGMAEQGAKSLWAYVDLRDAARAARLALEAGLDGFHLLNITSARAFADEPVPVLVKKWFPGLNDIRGPLVDRDALFDWRKAERSIGFRARYVWNKDEIAEVAE
jgi:UDP-glucose 4-epimerase